MIWKPRDLKREWRRWRTWRRALPRLERECLQSVERELGGAVEWRLAGGCGRDVICQVWRDGAPRAYLRLADPRAPLSLPASAGMPFVSPGAAEKIEREWSAYERGAAHDLTPRPLWRNRHALLSAYVAGSSLGAMARAPGGSWLEQVAQALPAIAQLHRAGISHMDMSLANILRREADGRLMFVDFEYKPAESLSFAQQCRYDYLRLFESVWKFIALEERAGAGQVWRQALERLAPAEVRCAPLEPLRPALGRILAAPEMTPLLGE